jgi:hypothetical protein
MTLWNWVLLQRKVLEAKTSTEAKGSAFGTFASTLNSKPWLVTL